MSGPLTGIKVIEWSTWAIGPLAGVILSDLGAEVIKVEHPQGGDAARQLKWIAGVVDAELPHGRNALFEIMNRNKRGLTLDLQQPEALAILRRLIDGADVFLENFRPGVADRLGIGYETLRKTNSRLINASSSGYGFKGEEAQRPGLDYVGQARSGVMYAMGHPGDPPYWSASGFADIMGGIMLGFGVVAAIAARERLSVGQKVEMSHLSATMFLQYWAIGTLGLTGGSEWPRFDRRTAGNPLWNHYQCADGEWLVLALLEPERHWAAFCALVGWEDLVADPRFCTSDQQRLHRQELIALLEALFATKPRAEWERILAQNPDFVYDRVQTVGDLARDPAVLANAYLSAFQHPDLGPVNYLNFPVNLSETPAHIRSAAPRLGEHTDEILTGDLGCSATQVAALRAQGAI